MNTSAVDPAFLEPFRVKAVEPIRFLTPEQRVKALAAAGYNLFKVAGNDVTIDLLTDSGTGALTARQWASLMDGDETYAGSRSFHRFESVVHELTGYPNVLPVHQGRAAERIIFTTLLKPGDISVSNTHFDTTRGNVELIGGHAVDLPSPLSEKRQSDDLFKGDIDLDALRGMLAEPNHRVRIVVMTVTSNGLGGHPVSLANLRAVREVCRAAGVPMFLDGARFAENAHLIARREPGQSHRTPRSIAREMFSLADGTWISLKKDAAGHIGGLLAMHDDALAERCRELLIVTEGFSTYGGLAGRDLEALATGLEQATDPEYLGYREASTGWFAQALADAGMPVLAPYACHAVYIDASPLLPHLTPAELPAQSLACELYLEAGIRTVELGTLAFGRAVEGGPDEAAPIEQLRLAVPRRVYTKSHFEYVAAAAAKVAARAERMPGYRIVKQPVHLRHFSASLAPMVDEAEGHAVARDLSAVGDSSDVRIPTARVNSRVRSW